MDTAEEQLINQEILSECSPNFQRDQKYEMKATVLFMLHSTGKK